MVLIDHDAEGEILLSSSGDDIRSIKATRNASGGLDLAIEFLTLSSSRTVILGNCRSLPDLETFFGALSIVVEDDQGSQREFGRFRLCISEEESYAEVWADSYSELPRT